LGGTLFLAGGIIMAYNLWMTVKAQPAKSAVNANNAVPAE
jgi:cytochrome c oxidase cbb3-type subunit 1